MGSAKIGKITIYASILLASFILLSPMVYSQSLQFEPYIVSGRVIDTNGNPVKGALVYYNYEVVEDSGGTYEGVRSNDFGRFSLPVEGYMKSKPLRLYITSDIPSRTLILLSPPFPGNPKHIRKRYAGPRLVLHERKEVDVGDVIMKVTFVPIILKITGKEGLPLLVSSEQWSDVIVRLLDQQNRPVAASGLSQRTFMESVVLTESEIKLALPEGGWRIEVSVTGFDGPFFGTPILVSRSSSSHKAVTLRIVNTK